MSSFLFRRVVQAALSLCVLATHQYALAVAPTCVTTAAQLQAALTSAATDHQANTIGVAVGIYSFSTPLVVNVSDGFPLTIEGGYTTATCTGVPTAVPDNTVISGVSGSGAYVRIVGDGGLTVRNLTFSGFKPAAGTNAILMAENYAADILRIENVAISGNGVNGINDNILAVYPSGGLVFDDNIVHDNANAFAGLHIIANYTGLPVMVVNNTIANNAGTGIVFDVYTLMQAGLYNNILWHNGPSDLVVTNVNGNEPPLAMNNTYANCSGCASLSQASANNSSADPKLTASYRLGATSPVINAGMPVPAVLPLADAGENFRVQGSAPDQGAYETSSNDIGSAHTYSVTSENDSGVLTLRQAITDANAAGAPALVNFHIGTSCGPQAIVLNSPLPAITVPMLIDGYSQVGASVNTEAPPPAGYIPTNATVCIVLFGASPSPANAISVSSAVDPSVHVEVRGLRFANFTAAIDLSGGNGHWIHGNTFAGPFVFGNVGNGIGVQIDGGFATVIGGPLAADVNLIGVSSGAAGVLVTGGAGSVSNGFHTIVNNSIGGDPTGMSTGYGNTNHGVELLNSRQSVVRNNWIVANGGDGIRIDGAAYNLVQANLIGSALAAGLSNSGAGVRVTGGASQNWVGTTDPTVNGGGNEITSNAGPGVWIDQNAGVYNQVTANSVFDNGGLSIDLAFSGLTANAGSESTGPNYLIHKPVITGAVVANGGNMTVTGSIPSEAANTYRYVTIYASGSCGDSEVRLGNYIVQAGANGAINLNLTVPAPSFSPAYITATDDDYTAGVNDTSEISNSKRFSVSDDLFNDSFDCY